MIHSHHTSVMRQRDVTLAEHVLRLQGIHWALDHNGRVLTTPIPSTYPVSPQYRRAVEEDSLMLKEIQELSDKEVRERIAAETDSRIQDYHERALEMNECWARYQKKLKELQDWDVLELLEPIKARLIKELEDAIKREIAPIDPPVAAPTVEEWRERRVKLVRDGLEISHRQQREAINTAERNTRWLRELLQSLGLEASDRTVPDYAL